MTKSANATCAAVIFCGIAILQTRTITMASVSNSELSGVVAAAATFLLLGMAIGLKIYEDKQ